MNSTTSATTSALSEDELDKGLADFVESFGVAMDAAGLPRAAGRMLAWLLVCDPAEQSPADLKRALRSSTGGVSQNIRMLMQIKFVERVGKRGDRRTYYRVAPNAWDSVMTAQREDATRVLALTRRGLELLADSHPGRRERLAEMADFYAFIETEIPLMMERYHAQKATSDG